MKNLAKIAYYACKSMAIIALMSIPLCFIASIWTEGWFFLKMLVTSSVVTMLFHVIGDAIDDELLD